MKHISLMRTAVFLLVMLASVCVQAQLVKGKVIDSTNGEPLFGAVIGEKGTSNGVTTDFE
jgi:hypothetical protein